MTMGDARGTLDRGIGLLNDYRGTPGSPHARFSGTANASERAIGPPFQAMATATPRRLRLVGELDVATAEQLIMAVAPELPGPGDLTLDLPGLDFIDCFGLGSILQITTQMRRRGWRLILEAPTSAVLRTLTVLNFQLEPGIHVVLGREGSS